MQVENKKLTLSDLKWKCAAKFERYERILSLVKDEDAEKRRAKGECVFCYYLDGKIGGAAMTDANCAICDKITMYGSTCVDILCLDCAKKNRLCFPVKE